MYTFFSVLKNDLLLHEAVIKNEADTVRKVLKETVDVDSRNNVSHFRKVIDVSSVIIKIMFLAASNITLSNVRAAIVTLIKVSYIFTFFAVIRTCTN